MPFHLRKCLPAMFLLALTVAFPAASRADDDDDHDQARAALERGEVKPLAEVLALLKLDGEIVSTEFEHDDDRWIYEIRLIDPSGRMVELHVDAATARILESETGQ